MKAIFAAPAQAMLGLTRPRLYSAVKQDEDDP
jgi:hypothetical protein